MLLARDDKSGPLMQVLADEFSRRILVSASSSPKTINDISKEGGIPLSTCYRKARELVALHLLSVHRIVVTDSGKKYALFRSVVKDTSITFSYEELSMNVTQRLPEPERRQEQARPNDRVKELLRVTRELQLNFLDLVDSGFIAHHS